MRMAELVLTIAFALALSVTTATQGHDGNPPTAENQTTILITTIAGFASLIATQVFALINESRKRKWDLADREAARREVRQHAETQRLETIQTAIDLAKVSNVNRQQLLTRIEHNTNLTQEAKQSAEAAYTAANNFNEKIETLKRQLASKSDTIDHIDEVSVDTNVKVTKLKGEHDGEDSAGRGR